MNEGSIFKRCTCKDNSGKRLGAQCPKLRRDAGGWNPHHGSWGYQLELAPTGEGRRRQLRRTGFDTRDAAVAELDHARGLLALARTDTVVAAQIADLLQEYRPGTPLPDRDTIARQISAGVAVTSTLTVAEYLYGWLERRGGLSPKTIRGYSDHIRMYLVPHLGNIVLRDLRDHHLEAMYTALHTRIAEITAGRASDDPAVRARFKGIRPMGAASLQRLRATIRVALNHAVKRHLIDHNPSLALELASGAAPKARVWAPKAVERWRATGQRPSPVMVWTPIHAGEFLDYAEAHDIALYALFTLKLHRGLRRGELCGLRDIDLDLDAGIMTVAEQITTVGYTPIVKPVKSRAGDRVIPLGATTIIVLRAYLDMRARWQMVSGSDWADTGLFFVQPDGSAWHPGAVSDRFEYLITRSGLPPVRLHDLRHCAATYLRHGGADTKEVQETLGHATLAQTSDIYTSVFLEMQQSNAQAAANLIPRKRPKAA
jgi:integrase